MEAQDPGRRGPAGAACPRPRGGRRGGARGSGRAPWRASYRDARNPAMDGEKTKAVAAIEAQMAQVPPGSYRHQVLEVARDFKNAWVSLGAHLTKVSSRRPLQGVGLRRLRDLLPARAAHPQGHRPQAHGDLRVHAAPRAPAPRARRGRPGGPGPGPRLRGGAGPLPGRGAGADWGGRVPGGPGPGLRGAASPGALHPGPGDQRQVAGAAPARARPGVRVRQLSAAARRLADGARRSDAVPQAVKDRAEALAEDFVALLEAGAWRDAG